jgi:hypothetical protein
MNKAPTTPALLHATTNGYDSILLVIDGRVVSQWGCADGSSLAAFEAATPETVEDWPIHDADGIGTPDDFGATCEEFLGYMSTKNPCSR